MTLYDNDNYYLLHITLDRNLYRVVSVYYRTTWHSSRIYYNMEDQYSFKKLSLKRFPKLDKRENKEDKFWKKFQVKSDPYVLVCIACSVLKLRDIV